MLVREVVAHPFRDIEIIVAKNFKQRPCTSLVYAVRRSFDEENIFVLTSNHTVGYSLHLYCISSRLFANIPRRTKSPSERISA